MGWYFAILFFFAYLMSIGINREAQNERDYWEREAKMWCAKLGEDKIERGILKCEDCPDEDTDKCDLCQTIIRQ